jgi:hypothetical protein
MIMVAWMREVHGSQSCQEKHKPLKSEMFHAALKRSRNLGNWILR